MNLGWKLALACKGLASSNLLDTYNEERAPVIREMLQRTTGLTKDVMQQKKTSWQRTRSEMQLGIHCRWSSIVLEQSKVIVESSSDKHASAYSDEMTDRVHAGDRAPEAPALIDMANGATTSLFDLLRPSQHTVVVFGLMDEKTITAALLDYPEDLIRIVFIVAENMKAGSTCERNLFYDSKYHARRAYSTDTGPRIVVIRPDGVIGALLDTTEGLKEYFLHIFNTGREF
jgi:hypothetical protein